MINIHRISALKSLYKNISQRIITKILAKRIVCGLTSKNASL